MRRLTTAAPRPRRPPPPPPGAAPRWAGWAWRWVDGTQATGAEQGVEARQVAGHHALQRGELRVQARGQVVEHLVGLPRGRALRARPVPTSTANPAGPAHSYGE